MGRNAPCPCGSGKKFRQCCRPKAAPEIHHHDHCGHDSLVETIYATPLELDRLDQMDELANRVIDLVHAGELDLAESLAKDLLNRYPDQIDGMDRLAIVYEARGDLAKALENCRNAAALAALSPGFGPDSVAFYSKEAARLTRQLAKKSATE